jgi:hypothetical protein
MRWAVAVVALLVASCGGSSDDDSSADVSTAATSPPVDSASGAVEPAPTVMETVPEAISTIPSPLASLELGWLTQIGSPGADISLGLGARGADVGGGVWISGHSDGAFGVPAGGQDMAVASVDGSGVPGPLVQAGTAGTDSLLGAAGAPDGGVYVLGYTEDAWKQPNAGINDIIVSRYAPDLTEMWSLQLGGPDWDRGFGIAAFDGGVYATGYTFGGFAEALGGSGAAGGHDAVIVRISEDGVVEWVRQLGSDGLDWGQSVAVTDDGAAVLTGYTQGDFGGTNVGGRDLWVARVEADGTTGWVSHFGTEAEDWTQGVAIAPNGDIVVVGLTEGALADGSVPQGANDILVMRLTADGELVWATQTGTALEDKAFGVAISADDWIVVTGYTQGDLAAPNLGEKDAYVMLLSADGAIVDIEQLASPGVDETYDVEITDDGTVYVSGVTDGRLGESSFGDFDIWVARFTIVAS